jgi:DNA-binding PadR family transcriptional regulator
MKSPLFHFLHAPLHHSGHGHANHHSRHGGHEGEDHRAMKRLLAHGDLRIVVLRLIEEQPRHGYELIKLIESMSSGQYSPSPGVIYPTLTYLEEAGLVATTVQNDKKQYAVTQEGIAHLDQTRVQANSILRRLEEMGAKLATARAQAEGQDGDQFRSEFAELRHVFHALGKELKASSSKEEVTRQQIVEILQRALAEIQNVNKA